MNDASQEIGSPSAFFREHADRLATTAPIGRTLDLACGRGRHALAAVDLGLSVLAVDRNQEALDRLTEHVRQGSVDAVGRIETRCADLETPPFPILDTGGFGAVLVIRYLHRPLFEWIESQVAPGGLLLYETFTVDQRSLGWGPKRDDFLLQRDELPTLFRELSIEIHEEGPSKDDRSAHTARVLARRPS